jgi:hypothetical protein
MDLHFLVSVKVYLFLKKDKEEKKLVGPQELVECGGVVFGEHIPHTPPVPVVLP